MEKDPQNVHGCLGSRVGGGCAVARRVRPLILEIGGALNSSYRGVIRFMEQFSLSLIVLLDPDTVRDGWGGSTDGAYVIVKER